MNIIEKYVGELTPYANNPRKNEKAVDAVAASIKEFGFKNPIIIDREGVIVAGHTRLSAAKKLGLEKVPCIMADDLTDEQIKAFRLADNKTAELAEWDEELLAEELAALQDVDMAAFGFDALLNGEPEVPDFQEDIKDPDNELPESHIYIYTCTLFGKTDEKLFEFRLTDEESEKLLEHLKATTPEDAAERIRGLLDAI